MQTKQYTQESLVYYDFVGGIRMQNFTLPSFNEFIGNNSVSNSHNYGHAHHVVTNTTFNMCHNGACMSSGYEGRNEMLHAYNNVAPIFYQTNCTLSNAQQDRNANDSPIDILNSRIGLLETKLNTQSTMLRQLVEENQTLKKRKFEILSTADNDQLHPPKKKEKAQHTNHSSTTFSLISQNDFLHKYRGVVTGNWEEFKVSWRSKEYVILNVFCNRDEVFNYFCPLFESQYPNEKSYRLVLEREDYRKLFKENKNVEKFYRQHAWRISIFSIDFFHFVRNRKHKYQ